MRYARVMLLLEAALMQSLEGCEGACNMLFNARLFSGGLVLDGNLSSCRCFRYAEHVV